MSVASGYIEDEVTVGGEVVDESFYYASQWELIGWRFRRHRLAMVSLILLVALYVLAIFPGFFSPYSASRRFEKYQQAPPVRVHFFSENGWEGPYYYGYERILNQQTFKYEFTENRENIIPIELFSR
ncbi:MAG: ABC transporter permease, partial [Chloroflexi bacterium]|nr:ABC transporter permease [Chloroflexota bacterium]